MVAKDQLLIPFATDFDSVVIKEEFELDDDDRNTAVPDESGAGAGNSRGGSACNPNSGSGSPESEQAGLMGRLTEMGTPPFLRKTFEMVEDPETDPIVSWSGGSGRSFVVWDPHGFAVKLLPKYFKHRNFSSFVRQLNTYGFRKVHLDRWEFANAGFQRGKKHLLKTIKRRIHNHITTTSNNNNSNKQLAAREAEIERLKKEQDALRLQILGLKQQHDDTHEHVIAMEERVTRAEWKQRQMFMLIAKLMTQSSFVHQLVRKYKQRRINLGTERVSKKRRLVMDNSSCSLNLMNPVLMNDEEEIVEMQSEMNSDLTAETRSPDLLSSNYILWEKLMEDDVICESETDTTGFVHELEDLIENQNNWGDGYAKDLVARIGSPQ